MGRDTQHKPRAGLTLVRMSVAGGLGLSVGVPPSFSVMGMGLWEREGGRGSGRAGGGPPPSFHAPPRAGGLQLTQRVRDEVQEGVPQEPPGGKAQQQLQQGLVLGRVGLHWDEEEDEVGGGTDEEGGPDGLRGGEAECKGGRSRLQQPLLPFQPSTGRSSRAQHSAPVPSGHDSECWEGLGSLSASLKAEEKYIRDGFDGGQMRNCLPGETDRPAGWKEMKDREEAGQARPRKARPGEVCLDPPLEKEFPQENTAQGALCPKPPQARAQPVPVH